MKSLLFLPTLLCGLGAAPLLAQVTNSAPPITAANPSGLLTPPPDNAPTSPAPVASTPSGPITTTTEPVPETKSAKPSSTTLNPREIARIQQQEVIRRQELVFRANSALDDARKSELAQDYPPARQNYLFAANAYGSISRATESYARAAEGLTRVDFILYDDAAKIGDTARAKKLIDELVAYNPNNEEVKSREAAVNRALANPNDTSILGNPAVNPAFVDRVNEVQRLFDEAEQFRRTGQWDEAEARLKRILGIDRHNIAAAKALERIDAEKYDYAEKARLETRDERLRQVEEKWFEPINNRDADTSAQESQPSLVRATNFDLDQKLTSIILSLDFSGATIDQATTFLSSESKRLDPDHKGVNFIIQPDAAANAKPISLTLSGVPLGEALRYVCQLAGVKYKVEDYAISIVPFSQSTDDLISRTFIVQPNFVAPPSTGGAIESAAASFGARRPVAPTGASPAASATATDEGDTVRTALMAKGVKFPAGASAVYTATTGQLTVVDTADQMELLEELVNAGQAPTLMVRIATKFVEINQSDLNDLTFNTGISLFGGTDTVGNVVSGVTALPGANAFTPDSIDNLISPQTTLYNVLAIRGHLGTVGFASYIQALSQKKSFDLLTEPAVLTKSGEQGTLEAIRVFPYPTAFDPPELVQQSNTAAIGTVTITPPAVVATTPTDFKRRNIGVRLVVKPQVVADNRTVDLSLFPEVTDFEGFINYGSPIYVGNPDGSESLLSNNEINQPVFNTRRINTKVLIRDGSTVVLGGLIREDLQTVNDRVPILGDIPLVGRLFQSKAVESTKRNLIIFVTANIYRNDGELLNPPEIVKATDVLLGRAGVAPTGTP
jgi:general secretion pathway protein D